jgi:hypothetical protein
MKSRRVGCAGHAACMAVLRNSDSSLARKHPRDLDVDQRIIVKLTLRKEAVKYRPD